MHKDFRVDFFDGIGGHKYFFFETEKAAREYAEKEKNGNTVYILKKGKNAVFAYDVIDIING